MIPTYGMTAQLGMSAGAIAIAAASNNLAKGIYAYAFGSRMAGRQSFCCLLHSHFSDYSRYSGCSATDIGVTIPKMLRLCFRYDRKLLGLLSQYFYASVKELLQDGAGDRRSRAR